MEPVYDSLGEFLIAQIPHFQQIMYSIMLQVVEKLSDDQMWILLEHLPKYCSNQVNHEFKDIAINQIRLLSLIATKARPALSNLEKAFLFDNATISHKGKTAQLFRQYLVDMVCPFLTERFSVYLKKEALNLIALIADLPFLRSTDDVTVVQG